MTVKLFSIAFCAAAWLCNTAVYAETADGGIPKVYPVEAFGNFPVVSHPQLSPDGKSIAYLTSIMTGRRAVLAHPISGVRKDRTIVLPHQEKADVSTYRWANNERLLVTYSFFGANSYYRSLLVEQTRLVSAGFDGKAFNMVKAPPKKHYTASTSRAGYAQRQSDIVDQLFHDPDHILLAIDVDVDGDPDIQSINVNTGKTSKVINGRRGIHNWITDHEGQPAMGWSFYKEDPQLFITADKQKIWSKEAIFALLDSGLSPLEIQDDGRTAIFYAPNDFGRWGLARFDLITGDRVAWLYSHQTYDVDDYIRSSMTGRIVGWSYGGYAALMGAVKTPDQFNCAVSINGVADLPGMWTKDGNFIGGRKWRKSIGERRADLKDVSPYHRAEEIKIPVLLIAAKDDWRVDYKQSKKMFKRLKGAKRPVEYVEIKLGGHSLDVDEGRIKAFTALVDFLEDNISGENDER